MATTWSVLVTNLREKTPEFSRTLAVSYLQRTCNELVRDFGLTRDEEYIGFVDGQARYDFNANILKVYVAELQTGHGEPTKLNQKSIRLFDISPSAGRLAVSGTPCDIYLDPGATGERRTGFFPVPSTTTLTIASSTNATPIVVTTSVDHDLEDGDPVYIAGHLVNTNANGQYYAKRTGYSDTTFALYSDSDLTTAVAGNGVGAGTGYVGVAGNPFCRLHVVRRVTVVDDAAATIPESMDDMVGALLAGAWAQWLQDFGDDKEHKAAERDYIRSRATLQRGTGGVLADVKPVQQPYIRFRRPRK